MFDGIFDIKNDRRLSIYLYRFGMLVWCLYLVAGMPALTYLAAYRNSIGLFSALLLVMAFLAHMAFESTHHKAAYHQKRKWLFIGTIFACVWVYVMEFGAPSFPLLWVKLLELLN
jgi:hypothetical protein